MKRSDFLKKLGIGLGVAVVAPQVLADNATTEKYTVIREEPEIYSDKSGWYRRTFKSFRDRETGQNIYIDEERKFREMFENLSWAYKNGLKG